MRRRCCALGGAVDLCGDNLTSVNEHEQKKTVNGYMRLAAQIAYRFCCLDCDAEGCTGARARIVWIYD